VNFLITGDNGLQTLDFEAIEAMSSSYCVEQLKIALGKRTNIFKIEVQKSSGVDKNRFLRFRLITGMRQYPVFYIQATCELTKGTFWIDHDISLPDIEDMYKFAKEKAAVLGD
jgi:hypothetical protein